MTRANNGYICFSGDIEIFRHDCGDQCHRVHQFSAEGNHQQWQQYQLMPLGSYGSLSGTDTVFDLGLSKFTCFRHWSFWPPYGPSTSSISALSLVLQSSTPYMAPSSLARRKVRNHDSPARHGCLIGHLSHPDNVEMSVRRSIIAHRVLSYGTSPSGLQLTPREMVTWREKQGQKNTSWGCLLTEMPSIRELYSLYYSFLL